MDAIQAINAMKDGAVVVGLCPHMRFRITENDILVEETYNKQDELIATHYLFNVGQEFNVYVEENNDT